MYRYFAYFLLLFSSFINAENFGFEQQQDFLPVDQAYQVAVSQQQGKLSVTFEAAQSYYLYRHAFKLQYATNQQLETAELELPEGIKRHDEFFGESEVYYQQVNASAALPNTQDDFNVKITLQGCADAGLCYPPYSLFYHFDAKSGDFQKIDAKDFNAQNPSTKSTSKPENTGISQGYLLWALVAAFLGGLILNLMPCVLPVLSIKLLQLMQQDKTQAKQQATAYFFGVVLSFVAVAALLISLRNSGSAIGWGFQLQQPWFVAALAYLFFVLALSMAGFIELGSRFMNAGSNLTQGNNNRSAFFTGILAVVVASPCTAPFMGTAIGYALTQNNAVALAIFASLGVGMALPLTLMAFIPKASRLLPKPGNWMVRLKEFFAYPLFATAIWLLWVLGKQTSPTTMAWVLVGGLAIAFAFWCFKSPKASIKSLGVISLLGLLALPYSNVLTPATDIQTGKYVPFSQKTLQEYRQEGQAVFIDLTADWCITCLVNEQTTLHTQEVQQAFADNNIIYMVGDWTNFNGEITALLETHQRSGVPLYLLYPPIKDAPPIILPQILSKPIVLDAIKNVSK